MQVTLNAIDWQQLTAHGDAAGFFEWFYELEDDDNFTSLSCYDHGWYSDSAIQYFEVAKLLQHVEQNADCFLAGNLREGIQQLIAENGHLDEFSTSPASDAVNWISVSPGSTTRLKGALDKMNLAECCRLLKENPPPDADNIMDNLQGNFVDFIEQHRRMVDLAVSKGYGLMGGCG